MFDWLPVVVGVGQFTARTDEFEPEREPLTLMREVASRALADVQASGLAARIDSVRVVNIVSASYPDPAGALAESLGLATGERLYTSLGGNSPQWLANRTADDLAAGRIRAALLVGAEALHTLRLAAKHSKALAWTRRRAGPPMIGDTRQGSHPDEWKHGAQLPAQIYPLFEIALRAHLRLAPSAHRQRIATLSASMARVAASNPNAWFRDGKSAKEIATVTAKNRMVAFPYSKLMNSMIEVDQAAAIIMTTAAEARALGIERARWVHLNGGGDANDIWYLRDRENYHSSAGMALAFEQALAQAGLEPEAIGPVDLYSCFPAAPQFAANLLGLPSDGSCPLTVTGGLPYFGGPGSNYTMHAIATLVERLRAEPGVFGLVSGLGWYMTRHAVGIYSTRDPARPWDRRGHEAQQAAIEARSHPTCPAAVNGKACIETYTLLYDREGVPQKAIIVARIEDGSRVFANSDSDRGFFEALESKEMVGARGHVRTDPDGCNRFRPAGA